MREMLRKIKIDHEQNRVDEIFNLMDLGKTMDEAAAIVRRRVDSGKNSELAFMAALLKYPGVADVKMSGLWDDYVRGIDAVVVTKLPLHSGVWEVQVKSNDRDCEKYLQKFKKSYKAKSVQEVRQRMAKNRKMLINAGEYRNDEARNRDYIRAQFNEWLGLATIVRSSR